MYRNIHTTEPGNGAKDSGFCTETVTQQSLATERKTVDSAQKHSHNRAWQRSERQWILHRNSHTIEPGNGATDSGFCTETVTQQSLATERKTVDSAQKHSHNRAWQRSDRQWILHRNSHTTEPGNGAKDSGFCTETVTQQSLATERQTGFCTETFRIRNDARALMIGDLR